MQKSYFAAATAAMALAAASPAQARYLQTDPIGYQDNNNLYAYVQNDPINGIDPTGLETHYVFPDGTVIIVQTYQTDSSGGPVPSGATIQQEISGLSGVDSSGNNVVVFGVNSADDNPITIRGNSSLNDASPVGANRSHIDRIDGRNVELAPNARPGTVGHEVGHGLGAGDQYKDGVDASGSVLRSDVPGTSGSAMRDLGGPPNPASVDEMRANADAVVNCPKNDISSC